MYYYLVTKMCITNIDEIDWNELWMDAKQNSTSFKRQKDHANLWHDKNRAKRYDERVKENNRARARETIDKLDISPDSTVLDIGAGPGTLTIPLAKRVKKVTVVDPSPAMIECLKENMKEEGLTNVVCINKKWEEMDTGEIETHDIVIASFSLAMLDIGDALKKMDSLAKRYVYLFWFAGETAWEKTYSDLWPRIHNETYIPGPKCNYLYNILYQMGVYANIEVIDTEHNQKFLSLDEAVDDLKTNLSIETPEQEDIVREYLSKKLVKETGGLVSKGKSTYVMIWWGKDGK